MVFILAQSRNVHLQQQNKTKGYLNSNQAQHIKVASTSDMGPMDYE
jgi:hypothetical protein